MARLASCSSVGGSKAAIPSRTLLPSARPAFMRMSSRPDGQLWQDPASDEKPRSQVLAA